MDVLLEAIPQRRNSPFPEASSSHFIKPMLVQLDSVQKCVKVLFTSNTSEIPVAADRQFICIVSDTTGFAKNRSGGREGYQ